MRLTFRTKLTALVATATVALALLTLTIVITGRHVEQELALIEQRHLPRLTLGPKLEAKFERIRRSFQDAVAAQDGDALEGARQLDKELLAELDAQAQVLQAKDVAALHVALDDYFTTALAVSRRLIANETGEDLVTAMADMQAKQGRATDLLKKVAAVDYRDLDRAFAAAKLEQLEASRTALAVSAGCLLVLLALSLGLSSAVLRTLSELDAGLLRFGKGDFSQPIVVTSRDELGALAAQANSMAKNLQRLSEERDHADWLKAGHAQLVHVLRGELEPEEVANRALDQIARYVDAPSAALYYSERDGALTRLGQYAGQGALDDTNEPTRVFRRGEGVLGQAAQSRELRVISDLPEDYLRVRSALGESKPRAIVIVPLIHLENVTGVLELALFKDATAPMLELLSSLRETLAIAIEVARARRALRELLGETQAQAQQLTVQEEELRATNEELEVQQEELRHRNDELKQQAEELEAQRRALADKNEELDAAGKRLSQKADELSTVSAYKSQFLANMSHELRTPLNSMLLLSSLLAENESGNLTEKQVEHCRTVYEAGRDLLGLINQVLDLAKIESGKQDVQIAAVPLADVLAYAERMFGPLARDKGLSFVSELAPETPPTIATDRRRVEQIVTNLIGNAIKFTEHGSVTLRIGPAPELARFHSTRLRHETTVALSISDTGIGIDAAQQGRIFAPFEQLDAAVDRRYGGTGLGLTIARELATLLGGELQLDSAAGRGSTFVCYLPVAAAGEHVAETQQAQTSLPALTAPAASAAQTARGDDGAGKQDTGNGRELDLLVIEDDPAFADLVRDVIHEQGLTCQVASDGQAGLRMAREHKPRGIILDVKLSDTNGFEVLEALRADPGTANIAVHFVSGVQASERGLALGAVGYLTKPASHEELKRVVTSLAPALPKRNGRVLIVEDDVQVSASLARELLRDELEVVSVASAAAALEQLQNDRFQCMVLDLGLPDMSGLELLSLLREKVGMNTPPVVVYTARALSKEETRELEAYAEAIVLKEGRSLDRLMSEVQLFARRFQRGPAPHRPSSLGTTVANVKLDGVRTLIVDDDMRTVYALSAQLRAKGAQVYVADNGLAALRTLAEHPDVQIVFMDLMMPEMDGYEAIRRIRQQAQFARLPIIALTAKAMKGDRDKSLEAGATDHLSKPIDFALLLALIDSQVPRKSLEARA